MKSFRKKVYVAAGYNTTYFGPGRKEFDPTKPMPSFESYLKETALGTCQQIPHPHFDEGIIGTFMSARFLNQANIAGFLPFMVPSLLGKPCTGVEGACGTGGRAIAVAVNSILSDQSDAVFVTAFEIQNTMKSAYGADVLAGAGYYRAERKKGHAFFFPGIFSDRAGAYLREYDANLTRQAMARWYEISILNARKNPKAQEYHNTTKDLLALGMTPPDAKKFLPYLNPYDCSKVTDGASSLVVLSAEGLEKCGIDKKQAIEIVAIAGAEGDITKPPEEPTKLTNSSKAVRKALAQAGIKQEQIGLLEVHDCFSISGLLSLEAAGFAEPGKAPEFVLEGNTLITGKIPTNLSGGLSGFGHPTGATGVRQMVDLWQQLTAKASQQLFPKQPYGMMINMGGNDITVTCAIVKPS